MTEKNREEIKAFAKKMQDKGAAGFAAGVTPWETWDDFEDRVGSRVWQGTAERVTERAAKPGQPTHKFGDRVLTAMTVLAVATLAIGIVGVYITQNSTQQFADNNTQLLSTSRVISPDTRQATAANVGKDHVALNDVSTTAASVTPNADNSTTIDTAAGPAEPQQTVVDSNTSQPVTPIDSKIMAAATDLQPAETVAAIAAPAATQTPGIDSNIIPPATPMGSDNLAAATATQAATPVAALLAAKPAVQMAGTNSITPPPVTAAGSNNTAATTTLQPTTTTAAKPAEIPAVKTPDSGIDNRLTLATLDKLPAPAAGTPPAPPSASTAKTAIASSAEGIKLEKPETVPAAAGNAAQGQPTPLPQLAAAAPVKPRQPGADLKQNAQTGKPGDWSINLASYAKLSAAKKMKARFLAKGVATDQFVAIVNGKTYYRLQVIGFPNKQAALSQSIVLRGKLGLEETWVTRK